MANGDLVGKGRPRAEARRLRLEHWQRVLEEFTASGLTPTEFCRRESITVHAFYWWRRQVKEWQQSERPASTAKETSSRAAFFELKRRPGDLESTGYPFELELRGRRRLRVSARFDPESLQALVRTVESLPC